jgi:hypothetical protein
MNTSRHERALLPFVALQGAIGTLAGFIGFFVVGNQDIGAMFEFTALMLTVATLSTLLAYGVGPKLGLSGKHLMQLGFLLPGTLLMTGNQSVEMMAVVYGSYLGFTWSARHWLEMNLLADAERDNYASHSGAAAVVGGIVATLLATVVLANSGENSQYIYFLYGAACLAGAFTLGEIMPEAPLKPLRNPIGVMRQREFAACLPLFFLESGMVGLAYAVGSIGSSKALASASSFGWVATVAALAGGLALYFTRKNRGVNNRASWLGASCLAVAIAFLMLGASAWIPVLYVGYSVLRAVAGPFLAASEHVLNQRTLDIRGELADRIVARDLTLWLLRMGSLLAFWAASTALTSTQLLAVGSLILGMAVVCEYLIGQAWFVNGNAEVEQLA